MIIRNCPSCYQRLRKKDHGVNFVGDACINPRCENITHYNKKKRDE